jgi:hypothetical protein
MSGLVMRPRAEVEPVEPGFELPDQGWHNARFDGIGDIVQSDFAISKGPRKGEFPERTYFKFHSKDADANLRSTWFDIEDPYAEIVVRVQNALAGRTVRDDEEFDFGDYEGSRIEVFVIHTTRTKGVNAGKTFADVTDARPLMKKRAAPKPADDEEDFPE